MRELKFRAWYKGDVNEWFDNGKPRMIYNIQGAYDGSGFDDKENGFGWVSCFSCFLDDETIEVMQYTGLKDKNDKEIYEGDIVKSKHNQVGKVYWDEVQMTYLVYWVIGEGVSKDYDTYLYNCSKGEVIGNIYEHPHLLEGEGK